MTDYYTRFSCLLDVRTPENAAHAFDLYNVLMAENALEDPPSDAFLLSIEPEHGGTQLWMRDAGTGDPQAVITFVQRCARSFNLEGRWGFQWANTGSHPRVNAYSGGAHILDLGARATVSWISTSGWLEDGLRPTDPLEASPGE